MKQTELKGILEEVKNGQISPDEAFLQIKKEPYADIGFAKIDLHRSLRQGVAEVVYGAGKTKQQILQIAQLMRQKQNNPVLITRMKPEAA